MAKIMLVEDDNNLREIYEARLQAEGYSIVSARDGEEALVVAKAEKPDLVISDIMMPKISGFEMLDILRNTAELKDVKVIMLTALGQSDDQQRADRLGADRYLVKSQVTLEDIVKVAHDLLEGTVTPGTETTDKSAESAKAAPTPAATANEAPPAPEAAAPVAATTAPTAEIEVKVKPAPPTESATPSTEAAPESSLPAEPSPAPVSPTDEKPAEAEAPASPEPVAEPAASVPTEEAGQASPETLTASDPAATEASAEAQADSAVHSTAEETASVETKIEDFVAGATTEPTTPASGAATESSPAAEPTEATAASDPAATSDATDAAVDDKLMDDAVNDLVANTEAKTEPDATDKPDGSQPGQSATATIVEPTTVATPPTTEIDSPPETPANDNVPIAHKKVIQPIDSEPKKDIDTLLALEEAKQSAAQPPAPPKAIVVSDETGPQATPSSPVIAPSTEPKSSPPDPNSIAL